MGRRKGAAGVAGAPRTPLRPSGGSKVSPRTPAIDVFIDRGLHALYDHVVNEPIPEELLRLIEEDRKK